ncbi:NAD(P)/FAD-dependent oxidoreductase [Thiolapillus sp.]
MPENKFYDYLIIGQGLAGSLLAWRLIEAGKKVLVVDDNHASSSTRVAAGVINPLAGKRFNHDPRILDWLECLECTYDKLARLAGQPFLEGKPMLRLFREEEQWRYYRRLPGQKGISTLLGPSFSADKAPQPVQAPLGGFIQHRTGYVRLPALLDFFRKWLHEQGALQSAAMGFADIHRKSDGMGWQDTRAREIIFCGGYRDMSNPWFCYLPFAPDKGEILTLQQKPETGSGDLPDMIINASTWLLPVDNGRYRLGSTHNHKEQNSRASEQGVRQLLTGMEQLLDNPQFLTLVKSEAGVRPATSDRQPFLGTHPEHPQLHIFNGFGAHGSLTIPWYSKEMAKWLIDRQPLPENADIVRFY